MIALKKHFLTLKEGKSRTIKASRQIIYSFFLQGISIAISLIYVPLLLNYLTQEKYGIWLTLSSILGWFSFFNIGLGYGMRNKLTEANAKGDRELGRKYVSTTYATLICIFSAVLFVFHIVNPFINWNAVLNTKTISGHDLYLLTSVVFTFFIIRFIVQLIGIIYIADHKSSINNFITAASNLLSLVVILILMKFTAQGNLALLGSIVTIMPVLLFIFLSIYAFNNKYRYLKPSIKAIDFKLNKGVTSLGAKFFLLQIISIVLYSTSSVFISQLYGPKEVVVYNLAFKYFQLPTMVNGIIMTPLWSAVTDAYVKDDFEWLKKTMKRLNMLTVIFFSVILIMIPLSNYVFKLWVGDKVHVPMHLTVLMALYNAMAIYLAPYSFFINGTGKLKLTMLYSIAGVILYFVGIYIFGSYFKDSTGVLIAILIPYVLSVIIQPYQSKRILAKKATGILYE
jgi:O-antigen/teichoic acid export membrane protein